MVDELLNRLDEWAGLEEWKEIPDFDGKYLASNLGRIKNNKGRILSPFENQGRVNKYLRITLMYKGRPKHFYVHRLVAMAWQNRKKHNLPVVHHKDRNTFNNRRENITFVSYQENRLAAETPF